MQNVQISSIHILTKLDLQRDYVWHGERRPPAAIEVAADHWFLAFGASNAIRQLAVIVRDETRSLWLLHIWREPQPDAHGRPWHTLAAGRLDLAGHGLGHALISALISRRPARADFESGSCELPPPVHEQEADAEAVAIAAATRVLELDPHVFLQNAASLHALVCCIGAEAFDWFAAGDQLAVDRFPSGHGVVITLDPALRPRIPAELLLLCKDPTIALDALLAAAPEPARREQLLRTATGAESLGPAQLNDEELGWLISRPVARGLALRAATSHQTAALARAGRLTAGDLDTLTESLRGAPVELASDLAPIFATAGQYKAFAEIFGPAAPGSEVFLTPTSRALWDHLTEPTMHPRPEHGLAEAFIHLESLAMFRKLSINALLRAHWLPGMKGVLIDRLAKEGLARPVAAALLDGSDPGPVDGDPPDYLPDGKFIASLHAPFIARVGARLAFGRWAPWWRKLAASHPAFGLATVEDPAGSWSAARAWTSAGATRDGELAPETFVQAALRWLDAAAPDTEEVLPSAWRASGCTGETLSALVQRADPPLLDQVLHRLSWLAQHGLADTEAICAALPPARFAAIARGAGADVHFTALVNLAPGADGPLAAPAQVPAPLLAWLPTLVAQPVFWSRWQNGIPIDVLDWLETNLGDHPSRQLATAVRAAATGKSSLLLEQIGLLSGALAAPAVCRHLVALAASADRASAEALLDCRALRQRPALAAWLRRRLLDWFLPAEPLPLVEEEELRAIAPLLDLRELAAAAAQLGGSAALDDILQSHPRYALVPTLSELPAVLTRHFSHR